MELLPFDLYFLLPSHYPLPTLMPSAILHAQAKRYLRAVPDIKPGFTVRIHERIQEGDKQRVQIFEGLVISVHRGHVPTDSSILVRRVMSGVGVERIFAIHSPNIVSIDVKKVAKVRRAKLFFLRGRSGRSGRLNERFTEAGEFAAIQPEPLADMTPEAPAEAEPAVETPDTTEAPSPVEAPEAPTEAQPTPEAASDEATPTEDEKKDA